MITIFTLPLPPQVQVTRRGDVLSLQGPLGRASLSLGALDPQGLCALRVTPEFLELATVHRALGGVLRRRVAQALEGVTRGVLVTLHLQGIGYRAQVQGEVLRLKVGYSHDLLYGIPPSVRLFTPDPSTLCLFGLDRNQVTQLAAQIRACRPPSVYGGRGLRRGGELLTLKSGKTS